MNQNNTYYNTCMQINFANTILVIKLFLKDKCVYESIESSLLMEYNHVAPSK